MTKINKFFKFKSIDLFSLRLRLTVGVAAVSAIGLGSVAIWTSWKMQQVLISTHKQNINYIAERFPSDVQIYSQMLPVETALQKAIDNITPANTLLWVKRLDGSITSQSAGLQIDLERPDAALLSFVNLPKEPEVFKVEKRYWVLSETFLNIKGQKLGKLYIAQDITNDQKMFMNILQSLAIACFLSILAIIITTTLYIQKSFKSLRKLSQFAQSISPDSLQEAQLHLDQAPTEVKELVETWEIMLARLSQAWEQERQFVSNVSHELRTPLTIVNGYLQSLLRRGNNLTDAQKEALEIASAETDRTIRLLQDLLDLARADSGNMFFHLEPIFLNELLPELTAMAKQGSGREINLELGENPVIIKGDLNRLKQVMLNLIDNALKYSEIEQSVLIKVVEENEQAMIQISDRGCGIPLQYQTLIFERFYRVDEARSRTTGGCGLGLSIVKTLVEGMGGTVTVRSQIGEGSIFIVTLPIYTEDLSGIK
jgi:signal transduction histidine kinase